MPQGTRKCGCPARWCSCGGTVNKSELRTKTKVAAVRKAASAAPPIGKPIQSDSATKAQEGVAKVAAAVEDSKKNLLVGRPSAKLQNEVEPALQRSEGDAKLIKKPLLKRGRSSAKSLGLDAIAGQSLDKVKPEFGENINVSDKQPANKVHKSHKKKVLVGAPVPPRPILRQRATDFKEIEKVQDGEGNEQEDMGTKKIVVPVSTGRLRSRIKTQIARIRREEALLEAYSGSHEKLRPEEELLRARSQIHRSKLAIRGAVQELEVLMNHEIAEMAQKKERGRRKHEQVNCAVCQTGHVTTSNDILLCDGGCERAFHQYCLEPAITPDKMPADEESWLCPACDVKLDCIHAINKQFGTKLLMTSSWQDVFSEEAEQEAAGTSPKVPQSSEWPSDDSADEDYDPDKEDSGAKEGDSEGEETVPGTEDQASRDSDTSDDDMDEEISEEEAKALLEEVGPDAIGTEPAEVEERPEDLIIEGKRRRTPVDYRILNFALFGFDDVTDDSDEDEEGAAKKRRTKNALEEPLFTTDVTGAPRPKADVGPPQNDGALPQVKQEAEVETIVAAAGDADTGTKEREGEGAEPREAEGMKAEVERAVEVKIEAVESGEEEKPNGVLEAAGNARTEQARASRYRPELEDVAYNVLKTSFLENQLPSLEKKQELCEQLKLPIDQVNRWFRGYRHKVLTALNRPPDPESQAPGSKYPPWSLNEVASEEAVERDRRVNMVLKSTGKLRAALAKAAELRQVARENGEESSEADSPRCAEGRGILARLKRKAEGPEGFAAKKGKRTAFGNAGADKSDEARVLQSTLQRLAALDTRPLSVNGNRMGRPPIRMIELMAEVENLHGGQLPELLAKHGGVKKPGARPPTLLQQSLMRGRRELGADSVGEDSQGLEGSDGSGSWGSGRKKVRDESGAAGEGVDDALPRMGAPKLLKEEPRLQRGGSFNSNQSFDEDESGLEDSWVAALDKRPFSKNGKRMGRPSRQVKEAILQFRREKHAAMGLPDDAGMDGASAGTESTEERARAPGDALPAKNGVLPRFSKSGKRIGRPPRALRKPEAKAVAVSDAVPPAEPLHRSDSFGSLDGSTIGPDGVRYSKSGRRIGKPQRLGVVDSDELMQKQEEAPPFPAGPARRMTSILGSFDDLTAAIDHLEKPAAKVPRRERSADRVLDERAILSGIRKRVASSNKLSAFVTSSGNDVNERDSGVAAGAAAGSGEEAQSARTGVNGPYDGANRPHNPLESLFTAVTAHEERNEEMGEKVDGTETGDESLAVEQLLIAVANPVMAMGFNLSSTEEGLIPGLLVKSAPDPPAPVSDPPGTSSAPHEVTANGQESAPVEDAGAGSSGEQFGASEVPSDILLGNTFSSSGDLAAMAASLMSPVRRPDRPPRKGGKRAFSSIARVGSVPGIANLAAPSEGTSV